MTSPYTPYAASYRNSPPASRRWRKSSGNREPVSTPPLFTLASPTGSVPRMKTAVRPQAVIIYWEDVLAPTSWLSKHLGLEQTTQSIEYAVRAVQTSPQLQAAVNAIEARAMELIGQAVAVANGLPVCIMADATTAYVEMTSALFFPRLTAALRNAASGIYVIGTPNTELDARELAIWKKNALHTVCLERFFSSAKSAAEASVLLNRAGSGEANIIALCGSTLDSEAVRQIRQVAPYAVLKIAQVRTGAGAALEGVYDRLHMFSGFMKEAAAATTAMTTRV